MSSWQHKCAVLGLLLVFSVWAGAAETAREDTDVPALPAEEPAVTWAAEAGPVPQAEPAPPAQVESEPMPQAELEPVPLAASAGQADRLELDATSIRGNQELPKVLYIVPWKDPELGDLVGKPVNSLVDEVLAPVDREVFRRQIRYFDQLYGEAGNPSAGP